VKRFFFFSRLEHPYVRHSFVTRAPSPWARQSWKGAEERSSPSDRARVPATPA
jgi:hypothetical protein